MSCITLSEVCCGDGQEPELEHADACGRHVQRRRAGLGCAGLSGSGVRAVLAAGAESHLLSGAYVGTGRSLQRYCTDHGWRDRFIWVYRLPTATCNNKLSIIHRRCCSIHVFCLPLPRIAEAALTPPVMQVATDGPRDSPAVYASPCCRGNSAVWLRQVVTVVCGQSSKRRGRTRVVVWRRHEAGLYPWWVAGNQTGAAFPRKAK